MPDAYFIGEFVDVFIVAEVLRELLPPALRCLVKVRCRF